MAPKIKRTKLLYWEVTTSKKCSYRLRIHPNGQEKKLIILWYSNFLLQIRLVKFCLPVLLKMFKSNKFMFILTGTLRWVSAIKLNYLTSVPDQHFQNKALNAFDKRRKIESDWQTKGVIWLRAIQSERWTFEQLDIRAVTLKQLAQLKQDCRHHLFFQMLLFWLC